MKGKVKVAIVDDHATFRAGISSILGRKKFFDLCLEASNGSEFISKLPLNPVDLILLDVKMPVRDGLETLNDLRKSELPPVMILTAYKDPAIFDNCIRLGARGFFTKSSTLKELNLALNTLAEGNNFYCSEILNLLRKQGAAKPGLIQEIFSTRERQVLDLLMKEYNSREIADILFLSRRTIEGYRRSLLKKTGCRNLAGLARFSGITGQGGD